jgi:hypothetical protein
MILLEMVRGLDKGGTKKGKEVWKLLGFVVLVVFGYISIVVVKGACVSDCRGLGLCTVG